MRHIINKYELTVDGHPTPLYLQSHGMKINESGTIIFYDIDNQDEQEIVYAYSPSFWNSVKLVE